MPKPKSVVRKRKQAEYRKAKLHSEFYRKHQRDQTEEEKSIAQDPVASRRMKFYESIFGGSEGASAGAEASSASELDKRKGRKSHQGSNQQRSQDPFAQAKQKFSEHLEEKARKQEEIERRQREAKQKQAKRRATSAKLTARTTRGQPIMKYQLQHILDKVKQRVGDEEPSSSAGKRTSTEKSEDANSIGDSTT
eukprot:gb/GECG01002368.1/.p1 GENE.gb/GECG01002368.1/~~gb/GECG01002368.1/.p1  ORF type:complete len:194 (+),score=38.15 gb/GECG01002368.1/:1-582(+)